MAQLKDIFKVTQSQYDTLVDGGTVGSHTYDSNAIYLVEGSGTQNTTYDFISGWDSFTVTPSEGTPKTVSVESTKLWRLDTRNKNPNPYATGNYAGYTTIHLKSNSAIGISNEGTYSALMQIYPWGDSSGGAAHQLVYGTNGGIYHRYGTSTWSSWNRLATQEWVANQLGIGRYVKASYSDTGWSDGPGDLNGTWYKENSFMGSVSSTDFGWQNLINIRHRGGGGEGDNSSYGLQIRSALTSANDGIYYRHQTNGTWYDWIELAKKNDVPSVSGTAGYIPKFTGASALGNSGLTVDVHDSLKINSGGTTLRIGNLNGSNSKEWIHLYTDASSSKGLIADTNISSTNGTIGTSDYPWKGFYLNGSIITSSGGDIGGQPATNRFNNLYLNGGVNAGGTSSMQTISCSTISGTNTLFDTYKSYSSYGTGQYSGRICIKASNEGWVLSGDGAYYGGDNLQSLRPQTSNYGRIGCDAYRFYEGWIHNIKTYTIVPISQTASSGNTTNTGSIGNSSYYYANMWSYKINFSTTGSISDRRLKENIRPTNMQALEIIKQLSISEFQYKAKLKKDQEIKKQREQARKKLAQLPKTTETKELRKELNTIISQRNTEAEFEIGLIAQELESVIPAQYRPAFITKEDTIRNSGEYSIKLNSVIYMAIKAIQEQQSIIESQQNKIDTLEEKISRLELIVLGDK